MHCIQPKRLVHLLHLFQSTTRANMKKVHGLQGVVLRYKAFFHLLHLLHLFKISLGRKDRGMAAGASTRGVSTKVQNLQNTLPFQK